MYKTSLKKVCSLNCCCKNTACSTVFVISAHGQNTNAQMWSLPFEFCELEGKTRNTEWTGEPVEIFKKWDGFFCCFF